ncbi:MAG: hypothetical protein AAF391_09155 [Bacteroidota bacterium]
MFNNRPNHDHQGAIDPGLDESDYEDASSVFEEDSFHVSAPPNYSSVEEQIVGTMVNEIFSASTGRFSALEGLDEQIRHEFEDDFQCLRARLRASENPTKEEIDREAIFVAEMRYLGKSLFHRSKMLEDSLTDLGASREEILKALRLQRDAAQRQLQDHATELGEHFILSQKIAVRYIYRNLKKLENEKPN